MEAIVTTEQRVRLLQRQVQDLQVWKNRMQNAQPLNRLAELEKPDPRATPDEFMREMLTQQLGKLNSRLMELETFLKVPMEDNLIENLHDRMSNLETAIRQLDSPKVMTDKNFNKVYEELRVGTRSVEEMQSVWEEQDEGIKQIACDVETLKGWSEEHGTRIDAIQSWLNATDHDFGLADEAGKAAETEDKFGLGMASLEDLDLELGKIVKREDKPILSGPAGLLFPGEEREERNYNHSPVYP